MKHLRPLLLACGSTLVLILVPCASSAWAAAQPGCVSTAPKTQAFNAETTPHEEADAWVQETFTKVRAAEGCNVPLVLPAGYDQMTPQQKVLWLVNSEREIRGLPTYKADSTLIQQIAYNHSKEESAYSYTGHYSAIASAVPPGVVANSPADNPLARVDIIPLLKFNKWSIGEVIEWGLGPAGDVLFWIYGDGGIQGWEHRGLLLGANGEGCYLGVGYFTGPPYGIYTTIDTACPLKGLEVPPGIELTNGVTGKPATPAEREELTAGAAPYTPPAAADTEPPVMGPVTYANGAATVTGVADSLKNVLDTGANPLTPAIQDVVFYTNNIKEIIPSGGFHPGGFNTVVGKETAPGTWSAPITVNQGEVLHAVAVDGSGNFTDSSPPAPAVNLPAGETPVALPAATEPVPAEEGEGEAATARAAAAGGRTLAAPRSAAALMRSIDRHAHAKIVEWVRVYVSGHWRTFTRNHSTNFPLYVGEGVVVKLAKHTSWRPPTGKETSRPRTIKLHAGWNFVSVPYPTVGMTCHAVRLELAKRGDKLLEITVGPSPSHGIFLKPNKYGQWGNDITKHIPFGDGFWIHDTGSATWTPSPTGYSAPRIGANPVITTRQPNYKLVPKS